MWLVAGGDSRLPTKMNTEMCHRFSDLSDQPKYPTRLYNSCLFCQSLASRRSGAAPINKHIALYDQP